MITIIRTVNDLLDPHNSVSERRWIGDNASAAAFHFLVYEQPNSCDNNESCKSNTCHSCNRQRWWGRNTRLATVLGIAQRRDNRIKWADSSVRREISPFLLTQREYLVAIPIVATENRFIGAIKSKLVGERIERIILQCVLTWDTRVLSHIFFRTDTCCQVLTTVIVWTLAYVEMSI